MIDVDNFKLYNDRYGHLAGDDCLRRIAGAFGTGIRHDLDVACRYGGEEFAVVLPGADEEGTREVAERIRTAVVDLGLPHSETDIGIVSVSIGIASCVPYSLGTPSELVAASDLALYEAKHNGRNQVCSALPEHKTGAAASPLGRRSG